MNDVIILPQVIAELANKANTSTAVATDFVRELFAVCSDSLLKGVSVSLTGVGEFKPVKTSSGYDVVFIPDKSFSDTVNAPFSQFEPVEIDSNFDASTLEDSHEEAIDEIIDLNKPSVESSDDTNNDNFDDLLTESDKTDDGFEYPDDMPAPPAVFPGLSQVETDTEPAPEQEPAQEQTLTLRQEQNLPTDVEGENAPENAPDNNDTDSLVKSNQASQASPQPLPQLVPNITIGEDRAMSSDNDYGYDERPTKHFSWMSFFFGLLTGGLVASVLFLWVFPPKTAINSDNESIDVIKPELVDTIAIAPDDTVASATIDSPIVDTITSRRFLATMAREHYGDAAFWVYIFEENKAKVGPDPNRIKPGTSVVIPPAEKYEIDASDPSSVARAKEKAQEIKKK